MRSLVQEKDRAIQLRKKGYSYSEILKEVNVAKSSLSLWLKNLPLTEDEMKVLKHRKDSNITRGRINAASELRKRRLAREQVFLKEAQKMFQQYKDDTFFYCGISLYWAEGAKRVNQWSFINSDDDMIQVMILWLERFIKIQHSDLQFRLFIHKLYAHENCEEWWQNRLNIHKEQFKKTIYKPSGRGIKKRPLYKGCIRIEVRKSKDLLLKMKFWQKMLVDCSLKR